MTDFVPPPAPQNALARFGTSVVGKEFEWDAVTVDGATTEIIKSRAAASISFEDTLRYTTGRHAQIVQTANSARQMREQLEGMTPTDDDYPAQFNALCESRLAFEQATWASAVDIMLILVNEAHREALRPALLAGDPRQVTALRSWLEREVIASNEDDAAVATNVDPTLPESPPQSASNPDSGDDSASEESSSTD